VVGEGTIDCGSVEPGAAPSHAENSDLGKGENYMSCGVTT